MQNWNPTADAIGCIAQTIERTRTMKTNSERSTLTVEATDATMSIEERLAEAHRDLSQKGEALRWAVMQTVQDPSATEMAYAAWKKAQAVAAAIYAEVKNQRATLAVQHAA